MPQRRFTSWIFFIVIAAFAGVAVWQLWGKMDAPAFTASVADNLQAPDAASSDQAAPTSSVEVPTTTAMELSDPTQNTLPGTLVVDDSSTANSADGAWSASMEMVKEYPITYSFNDGAGPNLVVDDAYLLITNGKTGAVQKIDVLTLATDKMIAAAKSAPATAQYEYVTYGLAWTAAGKVTGKAELYDVTKGIDNPRLVQGATFTVDPATGSVVKK